MLTLGQAATEAGVSKATISRAIASGRLSAARSDKGNNFLINPAELFGLFPRNRRNGASKQTPTADKMKLESENEGLQREVAMLRLFVDELRGQRDAWQRQAETVSQHLIADRYPATFMLAGFR